MRLFGVRLIGVRLIGHIRSPASAGDDGVTGRRFRDDGASWPHEF
ncbi:hypothetical protein FM103_01715 [Corynebacterium xerosis]|nr:hypothetical protein FM103_01715 [Corynebacterium xerosis]